MKPKYGSSEAVPAKTAHRAVVITGNQPTRNMHFGRWPLVGPLTLRMLCLGALAVFWEVAPRMDWVPPVMLAPLSTTLIAGLNNAGMFASNLGYTLLEMVVALTLMVGLGGLSGFLLGSVRVLREVLLPLASSVYAIPLVILYPVLTAWIGIGPESKIVFGTIYGLFPMMLTTAAGVQTVDKQMVVAARSMGATAAQLLKHIVLPATMPSVISGMRLGAAMTSIGVVIAEMIAATAGIGFVITQNRTMFETANVYFGVLIVLVLAGLLDLLLSLLECRTARRYPRQQA